MSKRTEGETGELQKTIRSTWLAPIAQELSDLYPQVQDFIRGIRSPHERMAMRYYLHGVPVDQAAAMAVKDGSNEIEIEIVLQNMTSILLAIRGRY